MFVVFGATGRVGGAAATELRRRGLPVRAVTRDAKRGRTIAPSGCEVIEADLYDESSVRRAIDGAKGVLLICPLRVSAEDLLTDAQRLIEAAAAAVDSVKPPAVVAISDYGAEHPSGTGIATIFHRLETRLRKISTPMTFLRSAEHMQNWTRHVPSVRSHGVLRSMHNAALGLTIDEHGADRARASPRGGPFPHSHRKHRVVHRGCPPPQIREFFGASRVHQLDFSC
jgi:NAD(P)H dehydrogenase (quinone)